MLKSLFVIILGLLTTEFAQACSFCAGAFADRRTLRQHAAKADAIVMGTPKNAKLGEDVRTGTTEFHFDDVLKTSQAFKGLNAITLPRYLPGAEPLLLFFSAGDVLAGVPGTAAVADYVRAALKLLNQPVKVRLAYYFGLLDSPDATVCADAFAEFAQASDAEIAAAKAELKPARIRKLLTDPKTPVERLGVFALLLGLSGDSDSATLFADALREPRTDRASSNLGGYLAGYAILDPKAGWKAIQSIATNSKESFESRLAAIGAVRYFQANRFADSKSEIHACYRVLLADADLADVALDDLRRWNDWDLSAEVLKLYGQPSHAAPILRNGIVRYALGCPDADCAKFIAALKLSDPKLIARIEESLKLLELPKK